MEDKKERKSEMEPQSLTAMKKDRKIDSEILKLQKPSKSEADELMEKGEKKLRRLYKKLDVQQNYLAQKQKEWIGQKNYF